VFPDLPTVAEAGVPDYEGVNWWGVLAPAGTPKAIVDKLSRDIAAALASPEVQKQFESEGAEVVQMDPDEFGKFLAAEMTKWERVVKEANIKAE
jgi:tripartite-type tricarboxylate transporter receptor subunit TctC